MTFLIACLTLLAAVSAVFAQSALPVNEIRLPEGFRIEVYASNLASVRAMSVAEDGTLFAGSKSGRVFAIAPDRSVTEVAKGLRMPVSAYYHGGDLYVPEISKIWKYPDILKTYRSRPKPVLVTDKLPPEEWHGWKFIAVGPDGKLYAPVGGPCNHCLSEDPRYAAILRMDTDGKNMEVFASGVRNTVGFDWHPVTKELWFTDNGRDWMGDNEPPEELNRAPKAGLHFGFPFVYGLTNRDPVYTGLEPAVTAFTPPELEMAAHLAPLGMRFYTNAQFPARYRGGIFIAQHGSWNRTKRHGYRVVFIPISGNKPVREEVFAEGWLRDNGLYWGRPADVCAGPDGSLFVADDYANAIYRITYGR